MTFQAPRLPVKRRNACAGDTPHFSVDGRPGWVDAAGMSDLSPDRVGKIGSSMVAALLGESPYLTRLSLYAHFASGASLDVAPNERMLWGQRLQVPILEAAAERTGWQIEPNPNRWVEHPDPTLRAGATVDAWVYGHELGLGVVEVKNVDRDVFLEHWEADAAPRHIEIQLQHQLWVTGARWGLVVALVGGNELVMVPATGVRRPIAEMQATLEREIRSFWREVESRTPPLPSGRRADVPALAAIYGVPDEQPLQRLDSDEELGQLVETYQWCAEKRRELNALMDDTVAKLLAKTKGFARTLAPGGRLVLVRRSVVGEREMKRREHVRTIVRITDVSQTRDS